jgi:hypothetical protein
VAGGADAPGATLGLSSIVGGLALAPPLFVATQPSLVLQLPLGALEAALTERARAALATEAALRHLLQLRAVRESSAPLSVLRELAAGMRLALFGRGDTIFARGAQARHALVLVHGRVDLCAEPERVAWTVEPSAPPPLGAPPGRDAPVQSHWAIAADPCLVLVGGARDAVMLARLLAVPSRAGSAS